MRAFPEMAEVKIAFARRPVKRETLMVMRTPGEDAALTNLRVVH
jgi:hypothetical protein